ncbi:MAG: hypothetical protein KC635_24375, partial [Myxococcales bacterium]|nr:hypothetical protein [Myxococcales bacterium]
VGGGYFLGSAALVGLGWLVYSLAFLPSGDRPPDRGGEELAVRTEVVDATGCEGAGGAALPDRATRLDALDALLREGAISAEDYRSARAEITGEP